MQEDVLGTLRSVNTSTYATCSRCSRVTSASELRLIPADALGAISEYDQLCPECYAALQDGDLDLPDNDG
ncbi:MAG TPA: hypothetical protein VID73_02180 [Ktedonobacterales bacterium]|jgi:hypothetical protein